MSKEKIQAEEIYEKTAMKFKPDKIKILFIAESPPFKKEGEKLRYFYFENVKGKDFLFKSIMEVLFPEDYEEYKIKKEKNPLLTKFKENGFFLIDAVEYPINQYNKNQKKYRDSLIVNNIPKLIQKLKYIIDKDTKIVLIKKNVYNLLFEALKSQGFNRINMEFLPFPSCGWQPKFKEKLKTYLEIMN